MTTKKNQIATFEIGKTYQMSFIGDSDLKVNFTCIKRTAKTATFKNSNEMITRKINSYGDSEYVLDGSYSMSPSIRASRIVI